MKIGIAIYHDNCKNYPRQWIKQCLDSIKAQTIFKDAGYSVSIYRLYYGYEPQQIHIGLRPNPSALYYGYMPRPCINYAAAMNAIYGWIFQTCDVAVNVNVDDYYDPQRIEILMEELELGADIASSNYILVDESGKEIRRTRYDTLDVAEELADCSNIVSNPCHIMKRRVFEQLKFNPALVPVEDLDYWQRCVSAGFKIKIVPEYLHYYRIHKNQSGNVDPDAF